MIRVVLFLTLAVPLFGANPYWVSTNGIASWANAQSATALSGTNCASLTTCNASLTAGNTAYLRGGTYGTHIMPANSGATNSVLTYAAHTGEVPVIVNGATTYATYYYSLHLFNVDWVKVSGITFRRATNVTAANGLLMMIREGSSFNEVHNCIFDGQYKAVSVTIWDNGSTPDPSGNACLHTWIHGCTFTNIGELSWNGSYVDDSGGFQLGVPTYDDSSNYTTIEDCVFSGGGHHNLETFTKFNVIRNNWFHNEAQFTNDTGHAATVGPAPNGLYGNRNIQIYDGKDNVGMYNLIEGNRIGASGTPPDDDGGDGLVITAPRNIIRYNLIYKSQNNGVMFKVGGSAYSNTNRFFNNTVYLSRIYTNAGVVAQGALLRWYGSYTNYDTVVKNNIFYGFGGPAEFTGGPGLALNRVVITNNWHTTNGSPLFVDTNVTSDASLVLPDLRLAYNSGAIGLATNLTVTIGAEVGGTGLGVADALYFQDGTWGSALANHEPDRIAVGSWTNIAQIVSIDYAANTIALASPISWADADPVWLYSRNDGTVVFREGSQDLGALEYQTPLPPSSVLGGNVRLGGGVTIR